MAWRRLRCQKHLSTNGATALWRVVTSPSSHQWMWVWVEKDGVYVLVRFLEFSESCHKQSMPDQGDKTWYFNRVATNLVLSKHVTWRKSVLVQKSMAAYIKITVSTWNTRVTQFGLGGGYLIDRWYCIRRGYCSAFLSVKMVSWEGMLHKCSVLYSILFFC